MREWLQVQAEGGIQFLIEVQALRNPFLDQLFHVASFLGDEEFFFAFLPLMYWCISKPIGRALTFILLLSFYLNGLLKDIFRLPRPFHLDPSPPIEVLRPEDGFGFPSGHAQLATAIWGYLATQVRSNLVLFLAVLLILLITFSRFYHGVHFLHDGIGGLVIGAIFLWAFINFGPRVVQTVTSWPVAAQLGLATFVPLLALFTRPADMAGFYPANDAATAVGVLIGASIGFIMEPRRVAFTPHGSIWQRALRYLVGILCILPIWLFLRLTVDQEAALAAGQALLLAPFGLAEWIVAESLAHPIAVTVRLLRYMLIGLMVAWWMPWVFIRLRLADSLLVR